MIVIYSRKGIFQIAVSFVRLWLKAIKALSNVYLFKNRFVYIQI